ncbi:MAG: CHAT domain-containing protein [Cyanobacteria bacterium P01_F01_bin.150]
MDEYLHDVRSTDDARQGTAQLLPEQSISEEYGNRLIRIIELGHELSKIQKIEQRTQEQEQRRRHLEAAQQQILEEFLNFIEEPDIQTLINQLRAKTESQNLELRNLGQMRGDLLELGTNVVLLYPLILDDRLELVLVTPFSPPIRHSVMVSKDEINAVILQFRQALSDRNTSTRQDVLPPAQQLYDWLIRPIDTALQRSNIKTIVYAPDGQLRYVPLAALHNGENWLAEDYQVNHITALSISDLGDQSQNPRILAGAFGNQDQEVELADRQLRFSRLPHTIDEVKSLQTRFAETTTLLEEEFSRREIEALMSDYSILHLATHATFVNGDPEESFILFGDGDRATFRDVKLWPLLQTELVVLSACETGVGGIQGGDGREILGFGYLMQEAGAKAAITSLWNVNDSATQSLMTAFYIALNSGASKAEALRRAQVALIHSDYGGLTTAQPNSNIAINPATYDKLYSHPYYWAPFFLIGNGF